MRHQWWWYDEPSHTTQAVIVDTDEGVLQWIEAPGCACGDNMQEQSIADYLGRGARWLNPPEDVREALADLLQNQARSD